MKFLRLLTCWFGVIIFGIILLAITEHNDPYTTGLTDDAYGLLPGLISILLSIPAFIIFAFAAFKMHKTTAFSGILKTIIMLFIHVILVFGTFLVIDTLNEFQNSLNAMLVSGIVIWGINFYFEWRTEVTSVDSKTAEIRKDETF